jgi:uncharacterized protein (DUF952 family)
VLVPVALNIRRASVMSSSTIYKLCSGVEWAAATAHGSYTGSADDARDGFIHFSTGAQLAVTASKYFRGVPDLMLVAVSSDAASATAPLKWERSRGGALFPHLYGPLRMDAVLWAQSVGLDADGVPALPEGLT